MRKRWEIAIAVLLAIVILVVLVFRLLSSVAEGSLGVEGALPGRKASNCTMVNSQNLCGCWLRDGSQEYWNYSNDGTCTTWDEADDLGKEESNLVFVWRLNDSRLTHIFHGQLGNQSVPKVYTVKSISPKAMVWVDDYGTEYSFTKTDH